MTPPRGPPTPPRPTGAPAAAMPQQPVAPIPTMDTRVPLNVFPPQIAAALAASWDKDGTGSVTIGELCAGAEDNDDARNARQARELARCNRNKGRPASKFKAPNEAWNEMPGDLACMDSVGLAEGQGIWERMAAIVRMRRLDVRILMDAHDRRNAGLVDKECFRRSLCYAFNNYWTELAMTSDEFEEIVKPYVTRIPNKPGEPPGFVFWQKFATDLQTLADRRTHSDDFMSRLTKIEARERVAQRIWDEFGITEYELRTTFHALKQRLSTHGGSAGAGLTAAFRRMDANHGGTVRAEEIKQFLVTSQRGMENINMKIIDAIVDLCDQVRERESMQCSTHTTASPSSSLAFPPHSHTHSPCCAITTGRRRRDRLQRAGPNDPVR